MILCYMEKENEILRNTINQVLGPYTPDNPESSAAQLVQGEKRYIGRPRKEQVEG